MQRSPANSASPKKRPDSQTAFPNVRNSSLLRKIISTTGPSSNIIRMMIRAASPIEADDSSSNSSRAVTPCNAPRRLANVAQAQLDAARSGPRPEEGGLRARVGAVRTVDVHRRHVVRVPVPCVQGEQDVDVCDRVGTQSAAHGQMRLNFVRVPVSHITSVNNAPTTKCVDVYFA